MSSNGIDIDIGEMIARVEKSLRKDKRIPVEFRALVEFLLVVVKVLVERVGVSSRNSGLPPSLDPHRKRGRKTKGTRRPGGQPGHAGARREFVSNPDVVEQIRVDRRSLPKGHRYEHAGFDKRQVIDIVVKRVVTEYQAEIVKDERGRKWVAKFPKGVTRPVQYGAGLKAKAVYMSQAQLLPYERVEQYFKSQCEISVSQGSLCNFNGQAYERLENFEKIAREKLGAGRVLHNDETGINIAGKLNWLHSASNDHWTLFFPHEKRGALAMQEFGILSEFDGVSVHDHWKAYLNFDCHHAFCNAHHLRELERASDQDGQRWAKNMKRLLMDIKEAVDRAGGKLAEKESHRYLKRYRSLLKRAEIECPEPKGGGPPKRGPRKKSKSRNLLERLRDHETSVLRFMTEAEVPFTNNLSERDIRMTKVQQKISGCFRSIEGARIFCRVRSYLSTCKKHGLEHAEALRLLFLGSYPNFLQS